MSWNPATWNWRRIAVNLIVGLGSIAAVAGSIEEAAGPLSFLGPKVSKVAAGAAGLAAAAIMVKTRLETIIGFGGKKVLTPAEILAGVTTIDELAPTPRKG